MKIIHNNEIEQITFLDERYYLDPKTQEYLPSATTILDVYPKGYGFQQWLKDLGSNSEEVLKRAGDQGTKIHEAIQSYLLGNEVKWTEGEKDNYTLDEWMMILKFVEFHNTYKPETIAIEISLADTGLGFGGTLDYICRINGEVWLLDWKSGGSIYKGNKIQISAYKELWNKLVKKQEDTITHVACVHLRAATRGQDKSGKIMQGEGWKVEEVEDQEHLFNLFKHAQVIWKEENPNPKPKNMVYPDRVRMGVTK